MSSLSQTENTATAMVTIQSQVPEQAMTSAILGTERAGSGVRIRDDGLIATVGYLVLEAEQIWITSHSDQGAPAYVIAQDYDSGITLLKPTIPLGDSCLSPGSIETLSPGEEVSICRSGYMAPFPSRLIAKQEFAGRWEYLLDEALFTSPGCDDWAGAALLNQSGQVCGIGSLLMEVPGPADEELMANMFIPVDLVAPFLDEMCQFGQRRAPPKPWLGALIQEYEGKLVVVGVYRGCPADLAGVKPGNIVLSVDDEPVYSLSGMFRKVWSLGSAGVEVPLIVSDAGSLRNCKLKSIDRSVFHQPTAMSSVN